MRHTITIRSNILTNFLFVVITVALGLLGVQYYFAKQMAYEATEKNFGQQADKVASIVRERDALAKETLYLIEAYPNVSEQPSLKPEPERVRRLSIPMQRGPNVYSVYVGYDNGDLFEVVNLARKPEIAAYFKAPITAQWMAIKVMETPGGRMRRFEYYDASYAFMQSREEPSEYRANERPWYRQAVQDDAAVRSDPYLFSNLNAPGITFSKQIGGGKAVLAIDFTLDALDALFRSMKFAPSSEIYLLARNKSVIASSETGRTNIDAELEEKIGGAEQGGIIHFTREGDAWLAMLKPLSTEAGAKTWMAFTIDEATMLRPYVEKIYMEIAAGVALLILLLPLVLYTTGRIVEPIRLLTDETAKIKARRFNEVRAVRTNIIELKALSDSMVSMAASIREYQEAQKAMMDAFIKIIADAIDTKSPYTGGHCKRVPVIAVMLAKVVEAQTEGRFASFALGGKEAWEEFEYGVWLHDCGKITTPEYVVDKATKLETIYNRIHEIRTRF